MTTVLPATTPGVKHTGLPPQPFRRHDASVVEAFLAARRDRPWNGERLRLSWSNWGFGTETLATSVDRLARNGIRYVELHGNRYGPDLGYRTADVQAIVNGAGLTVSGICGMATADSEFASNRPHVRQRAIDYFRRQADFCVEVGGTYLLIVPGSVGRPKRYDSNELVRAAESMRIVAEHFASIGVRGAIEPIRPDETSLCHTFADARALIAAIDHPGIAGINGDLYHMLAGEDHIGQVLLENGDLLLNLHMADTNRRALGAGLLDLDIVLMALYAIGYDRRAGYCTPEPLGAGSDPYTAMYEAPEPARLDALVALSASTFYEREDVLLAADDDTIRAAYGLAADGG